MYIKFSRSDQQYRVLLTHKMQDKYIEQFLKIKSNGTNKDFLSMETKNFPNKAFLTAKSEIKCVERRFSRDSRKSRRISLYWNFTLRGRKVR